MFLLVPRGGGIRHRSIEFLLGALGGAARAHPGGGWRVGVLAQERRRDLGGPGLTELAAGAELDRRALDRELAMRVRGGVLARELQRAPGLAAGEGTIGGGDLPDLGGELVGRGGRIGAGGAIGRSLD